MSKKQIVKSKQRGFTMVELIITISISALLAVYAQAKIARDMEESIAVSSGVYLKTISDAAFSYTILNYLTLSAAIPSEVSGTVAVPLSPTPTELKSLGRINNAFPTVPGSMPTRQSLQINISQVNCPGTTCQLVSTVCTTTPVSMGLDVRYDLAQTIADQQNGGGGISRSDQPNLISGPVIGNIPNPILGQPGGIACGSSFVDVTMYDRYVTRFDLRDPMFQGDVHIAGDLTVAKKTTADQVQLTGVAIVDTLCTSLGLLAVDLNGSLLSCQKSFGVTMKWKVQGNTKCIINETMNLDLPTDNLCIRGKSDTNANSPPFAVTTLFFLEFLNVEPNDLISMQRATSFSGIVYSRYMSGFGNGPWVLAHDIHADGDACTNEGSMSENTANTKKLLCLNGKYQSMDKLITKATVGDACAVPGKTAIDTASSFITLLCHKNISTGVMTYQSLQNLTTNLVFMEAYNVGPESVVTAPTTCTAPGQAVLYLMPKRFTSPDGGQSFYTDESASPWTIHMKDASGVNLTGPAEANAVIYCLFP